MFYDYLSINFTTLMILLVLGVTMFTNRKHRVPSTRLYYILVILLFVITILEYFDNMGSEKIRHTPPFDQSKLIQIRLLAATAIYVLRPFIILLELIVINPGRKRAIIFSVPAIINALIYLPSAFGAKFVFWIDENNRWQATKLHYTVYIVQLLYVMMLFIFSIRQFKSNNSDLGLIVATIVVLSLGVSFLENTNILSGYVTPVSAMCVLTYYIYLSYIHRQHLYEDTIDKENQLAKEQMSLLRSQIQPHFIYNSLNIIRTLIRTDSSEAIENIDNFSDYLKAHFRNVESDDMISFEKEIDNVKAFLALAEADHARDIKVIFDFKETDFRLPQLSLEPIVENALKYGIGDDGGTITISSFCDEDNIIVRTLDPGNGTRAASAHESERLAVGISNTRKRLELLCNGRLEVNITPDGTTADIIIPS
ncbi:MAG: histidine kinase [Lachnospiraceae bacterium]|nr:histidine kinase [Lachnospiraceae bacterium]